MNNSGLLSIELLARLNGTALDARALSRRHALPPNPEMSDLIRVLKNAGFRCKNKRMPVDVLVSKYPLPAVYLSRDGIFGLVLKIDAVKKRLLYFDGRTNSVVESTFADFNTAVSNAFLVATYRKSTAEMAFGFGWFFAEITKYKQVILEVMLGSFSIQLFGFVTPLFTQVILDKVLVHRTMSTLIVLAIAFLATAIFEFLISMARNYIFSHTANKIDAKLGAKLFRHLFGLPYVYFESRKVGVIAARVRELDNIREFITNKSVSVLVDLFFSLMFVAVMFYYSWMLTLFVIGMVSIVAFVFAVATPAYRSRLQHKFQMAAESNSYLVEAITGIQTVKSLAIEGPMQRRWEDSLAAYLRSSFKLNNIGIFAQAVSSFVQRLMTIGILYFGVQMVIDNKMTVGQLIAFQMFSNQFTNPVLRLVSLWNEFQQALLGVDRLGDILNHPIEMSDEKAITVPKLQGSIKFEEVTFRYSVSGPDVLERVSFEIEPGTSVGIVGRSGSGKSTITKLLQRLYVPNQGSVFIDNIDVKHMNPLWLRANLGVVLQENYLFSGTVRENISLPRPEATIEEIIECSIMAGAHDFIKDMPLGYDTIIGERGSSLSGGQRQRVAIARALIANPRILIFDEATSALDYESEHVIQENINLIKRNRTLIVVAHRLNAVKDCDRIIVMDKGRVVENDTSEVLAETKGYYSDLLAYQHGGVQAVTVK